MSRREGHMLKFCSAILNYDHTLQTELYVTGVTCKARQLGNWTGKFAENVGQLVVRKKHPLFS